jgi:dihydroorotase
MKKMSDILIKNARIVNEGEIFEGSVLIEGELISNVFRESDPEGIFAKRIIDAGNQLLMPGVIDDQVHFREPGLTQKGEIYTESKAAVAGGITSFMEMPNTIPQTISQEELFKKFKLAEEKSLVNFSFYIGATNNNLKELIKTDPSSVCGIKVFMGASTGNLLVDNPHSLEWIFSIPNIPIAIHSEDEQTIQNNLLIYKAKYGNTMDASFHSKIRSEEACYICTSKALDLAVKHNTRLHILHLSTAREVELLESLKKSEKEKISSEVCIHHLWFDENDYSKKGNWIKWNPSIKTAKDREKLFEAVLKDKIDVIATDHAPHTREEKQKPFLEAPSGGPMVQHSLQAMVEFYFKGNISLERIIEKMCHNPARIFKIERRGFIKENYYADIVLLDLNSTWEVSKENILYKCGWSPLEGISFHSKVTHTFVNGNLVYENELFHEDIKGKSLTFDRST